MQTTKGIIQIKGDALEKEEREDLCRGFWQWMNDTGKLRIALDRNKHYKVVKNE